MIVLHASSHDNQLWLWGEVPVEERGRARKPGKAQLGAVLPYDAGTERLFAALQEGGIASATDKHSTTPQVIWLPTTNSHPFASSSLIADPPPAQHKTVLAPWAVTTIPLSVPQIVGVLCACVDKQLLAPGIVIGNDLVFWTAALRFAGALVTQQQFLPQLSRENGYFRAGWKTAITGANADVLSQLTKTMPPVCRALTADATSPPESPALSVLEKFVADVLDYLVRSTETPREAGRQSVPAVAPRPRRRLVSFDSVHDQWLYHLRSSDGTMIGDAEELAQLAVQVQEWQHPMAVSTAAPFRLCFRLEDPQPTEIGTAEASFPSTSDSRRQTPDSSPQWYIRYLLQATDDPSLLIPTKEVWNAKGNKAKLLARTGFDVREHLLASLGQAAGLCPHIEASLKTATPGGYALDAAGAYEFLTEKAQALEQVGFGVLLPAWWTRKGTKLRLTARAEVKSPKLRGKGGLSLDAIAQFQWQVALGDEVLSYEELQALAKLKQPLVQVRGQWVQMNAEEIQAALDFWKKKATNTVTVREVVRMALGVGSTPGDIAFSGVSATGWIADLLAQLEGHVAFAEFPSPEGFHGTLRPYQQRGYSWLGFLRRWGLGACLADDMGLGKTVQTLALIQRDWHEHEKRPVLLICPTSVVGNWRKEAERFTPELPVMVHHGLTRTKSAVFQENAQQQALVVSSYALLHRDFETLKQVPWAGVILDEAQNIKNSETKQAKAARSLAADYRIALTGTPVENNVGDLWSIMEFLNSGFLGTPAEFKRRFFVPIQTTRDPEAVGRLKRLTGPFILRRLKTDKSIIADLPEKMEMKVFCTLTKEQASLYEAVVKETLPEIAETGGIQRRGMILAALSKLKQVCNHPAHFLGDNSSLPGRSGKLARISEMLEEIIAVGDRALVFTQFAEMGELLRRHLQETFGREVLFLHGGTPKQQRDRMVERFQNEAGGPSIFLLSLKAGGTGLNLTRANHVFHFDRWWNPAVENQATDRAFRIGQTKNVQVHKFLCVGTLEEKIDEMIESKKEVAEKVVGAGEGWLTELSTTELKDLFTLRQEAIGE
jgi:SNF2 family DNA or RNA helicase